jgi:hypothetical protein
MHLLRNSCQATVMGSELEAKSGGLFVEAADEVVLVFFFVVTLTRPLVLLGHVHYCGPRFPDTKVHYFWKQSHRFSCVFSKLTHVSIGKMY